MPGSNDFSMSPEVRNETVGTSTIATGQPVAKQTPAPTGSTATVVPQQLSGLQRAYLTADFQSRRLKDKYGADPTRRDIRRNRRYMRSDEGQQAVQQYIDTLVSDPETAALVTDYHALSPKTTAARNAAIDSAYTQTSAATDMPADFYAKYRRDTKRNRRLYSEYVRDTQRNSGTASSIVPTPITLVEKPEGLKGPLALPTEVKPLAEAKPLAELMPNGKYWTDRAKQFNFNSIEDVMKWQRANGLVVDGKFGSKSEAKWYALNGQTPPVRTANQPAPAAKTQVTEAAPEVVPETVVEEAPASAPEPAPASTPKFNLNAFAGENKLPITTIDGKPYARYDPQGIGDYYVGEDGTIYWSGAFGHLGSSADEYKPEAGGADARHYNTLRGKIDGYTPSAQYLAQQEKQKKYEQWYTNYLKTHPKPARSGSLAGAQELTTWNNNFNAAKKAAGFKQGGTMNRIKYFQQGGAAPQQDMQQQVVALVQAAMQGDQKATETVNQIIEAAKAGDQQAMQMAQMIQQVVEQMKGQATAAKWGAKLNYIRSLKYAKGGKTCPACEKKVEMKACGGKKAKKHYFGGLI